MIYSNSTLKTYLSNLILTDLYHMFPDAFKYYPLQKYKVRYWNRPNTTREAYHQLITMLGQAYHNTRIYNKEIIIYIDLSKHLITIKPYSLKEIGQEPVPTPGHIHGLKLHSYLYY